MGRVGPFGRRRWRLGCLARWWWVLGKGSPALSMDLPHKGVVLGEVGVALSELVSCKNNRFFSIISIKITNYSDYMA